jgi:hypothetical protein
MGINFDIVTGGDNAWGMSKTGLVVFMIVLMIAVVMLIVNAVYFFQVYNGASDQDIEIYWSRPGALALAIFNVIFAVLLGILFFFVLRNLIGKDKPGVSCIQDFNAILDSESGLPTGKFAEILEERDLAFASANAERDGYVAGIDKAGPIDTKGAFISSKDIKNVDEWVNYTANVNTKFEEAENNLATAKRELSKALRDREKASSTSDKRVIDAKLPKLLKEQDDAKNVYDKLKVIYYSLPKKPTILRTDKDGKKYTYAPSIPDV